MQKIQNLDDILPKEFVEERKRIYELSEIKKKSNRYWDMLGELMYLGGFPAVQAVLDDYITIEQAIELIYATRRAYNTHIYDSGVAAMAGTRGAYKPADFDKIMKRYSKE